MNTRIPSAARRTPESIGLIAIIESRRVILPLKGVECDFRIVSGLAEVSITQVFRQENANPLDCEYLFPLPADASVYACDADINGRTIRAQVRERQEALRLVEEKKAAGYRTALVESERENLFTLSLGNLQPGDLVVIQLKYFQTLRNLAGAPSLEIPVCPGVRYIPGRPLLRANRGRGILDDTDQVPDASRITPVRIDALHPDAAYVDVRGTLEGRFINEREIASPSHTILAERIGDEVRVSLASKGEVPDRDFVLRWQEQAAPATASRAWLREKGEEVFALLEIRAPQTAPSESAPVDFYFLLDRSGSMNGEKWTKAVEALQSCVRTLGPSDRAMITCFESQYQDFAERPMLKSELLADSHFKALRKLGTAGGTELRPALEHVLSMARRHSTSQRKNLVLITDAQIGNEPQILELMKNAPDLPVHGFGIDVALNDALLLALCRQQGGTFHSLNPKDDIERAVTALGKTLRQPVLLDLRLPAEWELGGGMVPNLYAGQIQYLSARGPKGCRPTLSARSASDQPVQVEFEASAATGEAAYLHWCRTRIELLVAENKTAEAIALSVKSNLICPLTAFVAWDESEKVPIANHQLVQPSMRLFAAPRAAGSLGAARRAFLRMRGANVCGAAPLYEEAPRADYVDQAPAEELDFSRRLSMICHRLGVADWQALLKAILDWVTQATGKERVQRIRAASKLLEKIAKLAASLESPAPKLEPQALEQACESISRLLQEFVEKLPARAKA